MKWKITIGCLFAALAMGAASIVAIKILQVRDHHSERVLVLASRQDPPAFPLQVAPDRRYLIDAAGEPFLLHGDTAWSLIADLSRQEAEIYLTDRRARGFNTLVVNLLEHRFARNAPANAYGDLPFLQPGEFALPNDAYFAHADWVLARARDLGFLVLLAPAYAGYGGDGEGWWQEMTASGPQALYEYGKFLGARYDQFDNVIWLESGDFDPPDKQLVRAIVRGIKEVAPRQLHTVHPAPETSAADFWKGDAWIDLLPVYTYRSVCDGVRREFAADPARPLFLLESKYENEHGADAKQLRRQAYEALLCGAAGEISGSNPIWHFNHPGLFEARDDWWQSLGSTGAQSMTHLYNLFSRLPWWELQPHDGLEQDSNAVAAGTADGTLTVMYVSGRRALELDLSGYMGPVIDAYWFDPASGETVGVVGSPLARRNQVLRTPGSNADGDDDWVLVLGKPSD